MHAKTPTYTTHVVIPISIFLEWQVHLILKQWQCIVVEGWL